MSNAKLKILIADGSGTDMELLLSMLEDQYEIALAEDGAGVVELLKEDISRFSVLLLDLQTPVMDGFEILDHMNKSRWIDELPVIVISSETDFADIEKAFDLGAADYIPRPFCQAVALHRIQNTILLHAGQKQLAEPVAEQVQEGAEKHSNAVIRLANSLPDQIHADRCCRLTGGEAKMLLSYLSMFYDTARLVDPVKNIQVTLDDSDVCRESPYCCYRIWNREEKCENCISARCIAEKGQLTKFEYAGEEIYHVRAAYVEVDGRPLSLELVDKAEKEIFLHGMEKVYLIKSIEDYKSDIYTDPLTGIRNRRYYEEKLKHRRDVDAVAIADINLFKNINDTCGHRVGDWAIRQVAKTFSGCVRRTDKVVRYGGDEFVIVFPDIPSGKFAGKLEEMAARVQTIILPGHDNLHLSVSIGGVYGSGLVSEMVAAADELMYQAKKEKCGVKVRRGR